MLPGISAGVYCLTKLRVYEYAKQLNMSSKEIITILGRLDVPVANHMSVMDDAMVQKVEQFFSDVKKRAAERHATEVEREAREKQKQRERAARLAEAQRAAEQSRDRGEGRPTKVGMDGRSSGTGMGRPAARVDSPSPSATPASAARRQGAAGAPADKPGAPREAATTRPTHSYQTTVEATPSVAPEQVNSKGDQSVTSPQPILAQEKSKADEMPLRGDGGNASTGEASTAPRPRSELSTTDQTTAQPTDANRSSRAPASAGRGGFNRPANSDGTAGTRGTFADGNRPSGTTGGNRDGGARSAGGYGGNRDGARPGGGGYGGNRDGNRPSGGYGGNRDTGARSASGYGGNRDGARPAGGGYGGNRDGNRPSGGYGGNRDGARPAGGGYGGNRDGARPAGGGYGGNRDGNRPAGGYGGNRDGGRSGGGARPGGGFGANRSGARSGAPGSRTGSSMMPAQQKPASPMARKDKEKDRARDSFDRDRREQFNENKLVRSGGRRGGMHTSRDTRRVELPTEVTVEGPMTVADFAKLLRREPSDMIKKLLFLGVMATINQDIDITAMELIAGEYGVKLNVIEPVDEEAVDMLVEEDNPEELESRPSVVTIMGHVDHGKTTLLDAIRESKVVSTEAGGITQHIGAYQVEINGRKITFLDTPGHEAFTTMRARGAQVTDITVLVVAADDGVMPQTVEAINHAKAANVPIIVAVNKIDKPGANTDRVKQELTAHGLVSEEWGGDTIFVEVSALKHTNLDSLLEMILLVGDIAELKANPNARARGTVIEAKLDKGRGPVASVLVQNGTLKIGDIVVAGTTYGRVRAMVNDVGKRLKDAGPSTPVEIQGLADVPSAGDLFVVYDDERHARALVEKRTNRERAEQLSTTSRVTLDDLYRQIQEGNVKDLNVIVKADVQGSVEALVGAIEKIDVEGVRVKVIHKGAGAITESDVSLASASNAIIIGFHVRPDVGARRAAESEKVDIRLYRVIYNVTEELESAMKGMLDPEFKEVVYGHAEVRQTFKISKIGTVAGCFVVDGKMMRDAETRVIRDGVVVYEGNLDSLKRFKDDAREVASGFECGITLEKFNDIKVGDVIEAFKMEAVKVH